MKVADKKKIFTKYHSMMESYLWKVVKDLKDCPRELRRGIEYALFPGGKRLRPILCLLSYFAAGGKSEKEILPFASALEMIHSFSLIHDDLPAIDDDDMRRGKPTLHRVFGEGIAILVGDCLLTLAFETIFKTLKNGAHPPRYFAFYEILKACGVKGMVGGQVMELTAPKNQTEDFYFKVSRKKTSSLITAGILVGAILAGLKRKKLQILRKAANAFGVAFQLADDIQDHDGLVKICGKVKTEGLKRFYGQKAILYLRQLGKEFEPLAMLVSDTISLK